MKNYNAFVNGATGNKNWTSTENGADALSSTGNALLDLFGVIGALRSRPNDVVSMFEDAFAENALLATKMAFYARNVRGGLGERNVSRLIWNWLASNHPEIMIKNLEFVPVFGRWDDMYSFVGTPVENEMWKFLWNQFYLDYTNALDGTPISLLAKWLKSVNTSSKESVRLGKLTARKFGLSQQTYRKMLATVRSRLNLTETKMSSNKWHVINYSSVPSKAMANYRKAFARHDSNRFSEFLNSVEKGDAKINAGTLYPYDIVEKIMRHESDKTLELLWKSLPNYIEGENNVLVMADVSGSMEGRPMATSIGLAIYFAERNKGQFANMFMTFSGEPDFVVLNGNTLYDKIYNARNAHWQMNTDFLKALKKILDVAVTYKVAKSEMPKALICISDMEFDMATGFEQTSFYQIAKQLFEKEGYEVPQIVFWNVDSRNSVYHAEVSDKGVNIASGQSPSVFKAILDGLGKDAYEMMVQTLNNPIYDCIAI